MSERKISLIKRGLPSELRSVALAMEGDGYPWNRFAETVRLAAGNYRGLCDRIKELKVSCDIPMPITPRDSFAYKRYYKRELGQILVHELCEKGLCRVRQEENTDGTVHVRLDMCAVEIRATEELLIDEEEPNENQT